MRDTRIKATRKKASRLPVPAPEEQPSKKTNLELTPEATACLHRLKSIHGVNRTFAISRGVILLEQSLAVK
jgi:hypothetical protein